jgi:hypothetical protein
VGRIVVPEHTDLLSSGRKGKPVLESRLLLSSPSMCAPGFRRVCVPVAHKKRGKAEISYISRLFNIKETYKSEYFYIMGVFAMSTMEPTKRYTFISGP